jgi:hypothetical protein
MAQAGKGEVERGATIRDRTINGRFAKYAPLAGIPSASTPTPCGHLLPDANERAIATLDAEFERWSKAT